MDLALNAAGDDLDLTDGHASLVVGASAVAQSIAMRLGFWQGESMYDRAAGVPWIQAILGHHPDDVIAFFLEAEIEATPGVRGLVEPLAVELDTDTRRLGVTGRVRLESGDQPIEIGTTIVVP